MTQSFSSPTRELSITSRTLAAVLQADRPVSLLDVCQLLGDDTAYQGKTYRAASRALRRLVDRGAIQKLDWGVYAPLDTPVPATAPDTSTAPVQQLLCPHCKGLLTVDIVVR